MRLIDADALWERLDYEPWENNTDRDSIALPLVVATPTVNAVPVIYCKDCKYRNGFPGQPNIICGNMKDEDFCSYGERKE